ncbi:DUF3021 domain-containing protein [Ruminococcus sp.]|uniref:DUF3021 domain-containing protein n=1 Tax=Ruminococcus sp. TaxID=41978 RepID=UPI0025D35D8C|nr:DUF3021 domain-containing protein [Ruminococcus sp.]MCI6616477.1 DUF3021 domain-containing protein [Ruminococcus sp.]
MKDTVKLVISHFFIITTGVLFIISLSNLLFDGNEPLSPELPWQIFLTGILGALPSFLFSFKNEPTKKQFRLRTVIHFIVIEAVVMTEGALFGWYGNFVGALVFFAVVLAVYLFVWAYSYFMNIHLAKGINAALKRFNEDDEDEI